MRLITHNMLKCNVKGVENGYPLKIEASSVEEVEAEYDENLARRMLGKINLAAVQSALADLNLNIIVSESDDESNLKLLHHVLFEIHILEGSLVCPESGRRFPVKDGIPNMLLHEDEVWLCLIQFFFGINLSQLRVSFWYAYIDRMI